MDQHAQSTAGTPAPYGQACANCARSKCKCIIRGQGACERCIRLNQECRPAQSIRRRRSRKPTVSRTARLEEKLDSLVSMMKAGTHANVSAHEESGGFSVPISTNHHTEMLTPAAGVCMVDDTMRSLSSNAEQVLERFRTLYLENFPFVHIPPTVTAETLSQERPFLWLCITAITSKSTSQQQVLASSVRQRIAQEIVVESERNIDLLLGLLVFIGWAHYQIQSKPFVTVFTQLAMSLVFDLGLNHSVPDDTQILPCAKQSCRKPTTPRTMEERRAVLSCYLLTSMISSFLQKIDVLRWTAHMDECLRILDEEKECRNDEILVHQIRLRVLGEKIASSKAYQSKVTLFEAPMADHCPSSDTYEFQLHKTKAELLSRPQAQVVLLHLYSLELDIAFPANQSHIKQSISRGPNDLNTIFKPLRNWFEAFLTIPASAYSGFPFSIFSQLVRCVTTLYCLTTDTSSSSAETVWKTVDPLLVLDHVVSNLEQVKHVADLDNSYQPEMDPYFQMAQMLRSLRPIWEVKLKSKNATNIPCLQVINETPSLEAFENEFLESEWLLEFFGSHLIGSSSSLAGFQNNA